MGVLALLVVPAGVAAARRYEQVTLVQACIVAAPVTALVGLIAILFARRARVRTERTLGRIGGGRVAGLGRALGVLAVCVAITTGLALGFFGLLTLYER
jgi:hypothetical protein